MKSGFDSIKDLCEVLLIPAVGGAIALLWPWLQGMYRRRRFEALIARELEEVAPYPQEAQGGNWKWTQHLPRRFMHQVVFESVSENRDFILSLDPDLAYLASQLWEAKRIESHAQWIYCLDELGKRFGGETAAIGVQWRALMKAYKLEVPSKSKPPATASLNRQ